MNPASLKKVKYVNNRPTCKLYELEFVSKCCPVLSCRKTPGKVMENDFLRRVGTLSTVSRSKWVSFAKLSALSFRLHAFISHHCCQDRKWNYINFTKVRDFQTDVGIKPSTQICFLMSRNVPLLQFYLFWHVIELVLDCSEVKFTLRFRYIAPFDVGLKASFSVFCGSNSDCAEQIAVACWER